MPLLRSHAATNDQTKGTRNLRNRRMLNDPMHTPSVAWVQLRMIGRLRHPILSPYLTSFVAPYYKALNGKSQLHGKQQGLVLNPSAQNMSMKRHVR